VIRSSPMEGPDSGFTLIEVLVATSLLAIVASLIVASINSSNMALASLQRNLASDEMPLAQSFVRSAIAGVRPVPGVAGPDGGSGSLVGSENGLALVTTAATASRPGGLFEVTIALEPSPANAGSLDLVANVALHRAPNSGPLPPHVPGNSALIAAGVSSAHFSYFGVEKGAETATWLNSWTDASRLPLMVALDVAFPPGDARVWPRLVAPLAVTRPP